MKNTRDIIAQIIDTVFPNEYEQIDAQKLQDLLKEFANSLLNKQDTVRIGSDMTANGTNSQTITFSSNLPSADYSLSLTDHVGNLGITLVPGSKSASGFQINSFDIGTFDYIAILNI